MAWAQKDKSWVRNFLFFLFLSLFKDPEKLEASYQLLPSETQLLQSLLFPLLLIAGFLWMDGEGDERCRMFW